MLVSWWHFQEITIPGGSSELEGQCAAIKAAAAGITLDGDNPVKIDVKEQDTDLTDEDLLTLSKIWPAPRADAA